MLNRSERTLPSLQSKLDPVCQKIQDWQEPQNIRPYISSMGAVLGERGSEYYSGHVKEKRGTFVYIQYDDGDEEWTTVYMLRHLVKND